MPLDPTEARVDADAFNAFEAAGWEEQAAGYEDFFGQITTRLVEPLLDAAEIDRGKRVLDVATGPGNVAAKAAERGAATIGLDNAEAMLSIARRRHPQLEFCRGNVEALPFPDHSSMGSSGTSSFSTSAGRSRQPRSSSASSHQVADSHSPSGTYPSERDCSECSSTR